VPTPLPHGYSPTRAMNVTFRVDSGLRVISGHYGAQKPPREPRSTRIFAAFRRSGEA